MLMSPSKIWSLGLPARRVAASVVNSVGHPLWRLSRVSYCGSARMFQENTELVAEQSCINRRKLFVKRLKYNTKEDDFREYFSSFGEIEEVQFPVTNTTRRCKGFAFITYQSESDAQRVLAHSHLLQGRDLIVEYVSSKPPPTPGRSNVICVLNLSPSTTREQVFRHFSAFGNVLSVDFVLDPVTETRRPFCFVHFETDKEADAALRTRTQSLNSCEVEIRKSLSRRSPTKTDRVVLYPPQEATVESLKEYFEKFGKVMAVVMNFVLGESGSDPKLVAHVRFENTDTVLKLLNEPHVIDGKEITVYRGDPVVQMQTTADLRVLVDAVPVWINQKEVKKYFEQFGPVNSCFFLSDRKTGGIRDWCLVSFTSVSSVNRAVQKTQHMIGGEEVRVRRKGWQSEEIRSRMNTSTDFHYL